MQRYDYDIMKHIQNFEDKCKHISNQDFTKNNWIKDTYTDYKYLQFSNCKFTKNFFDTYINNDIEILCFTECKFMGINSFKNLPKLTKLIFKNACSFENLTLELSSPNLQILKIMDLNIHNLNIQAEKLNELHLYNLPFEIIKVDAPNLTILKLEYVKLFDMDIFTNLLHLHIMRCNFFNIKIPINLKVINIEYNTTPFENLNFLLNCEKLESVFIKDCKILSLNGIQNCPIHTLNLYGCQFTSIDELLPLKSNLVNLTINFNSIKNIDILNNFKNLSKLDAGCNEIEEVNLSLPKLKILILNENILENISLNCPLLTQINLDDNHLTNLNFLSNWANNLQCIFIRSNTIVNLKSLINLPNLEEIYCEENPLLYENIPEEIVELTDMYQNEEGDDEEYYDEEEDYDEDENCGKIYRDKQNVHNAVICKSISKSIQEIMKENIGNTNDI